MTKNTTKTYIITAGGTGGHIFPALNLAGRLLSASSCKVVFITDKRFKDSYTQKYSQVFANNNFVMSKISILSTSGIKNPFILLKFLLSLFVSLFECVKLFFTHKPNAIIAFGGYVCFPPLILSVLTKKTIYLQEQNSVLGRVNKFFLPFCKAIYTSFSDVKGLKKSNKMQVCNILFSQAFEDILSLQNIISKSPMQTLHECIVGSKINFDAIAAKGIQNLQQINITIIGGSLGASVFGVDIAKCLSQFRHRNINVVHQVRQNDLQQVVDIYKQNNITAIVDTFFNDSYKYILQSDIFVSRCGASSIFEGFVSGSVCIFVPIENSIGGHQLQNAKAIAALAQKRIFIENQKSFINKICELLS